MALLFFFTRIFPLIGLAASPAAAPTTWERFLALAEERNLDLKIEEAKLGGAEARANGPALPAPMIGITRMKEADGTTARGFELSQSLPFPTKIAGDFSSRKREATAQEKARAAKHSEVRARAKFLYVSLWAAQEKIALLHERKTVLKNHLRLARSTVRSDSFASIHVLSAESDLDFLENELSEAMQSLRERKAEAAAFLNMDSAAFGGPFASAPVSPVPAGALANPQIQALESGLEGAKARELEADSAWLPDFQFRYKRMGASSMFQKYDEYMIGISVPFAFPWQPYSEAARAGAEVMRKEYELERAKRAVEAEQESLRARILSIREQLDTLNEKILPRAEKRMKIVHNIAPRDMETLTDHRETMEAFPLLKIKALELRVEYEKAMSELEKYRGVP